MQGAYSKVFNCHLKEGGEQYVVKITKINEEERNAEREIQIMKVLVHDIVPKIYESFIDEVRGYALLVMERFEGDNLETLVENKENPLKFEGKLLVSN